jgi:chemotaxis protein CheD
MPLQAQCLASALLNGFGNRCFDPAPVNIVLGVKENRMISRAMPQLKNQNKRAVVNIKIGDYYASKEPEVIHTVLGSCVAVCLFDPEHHIGGMNHILLPGKPDLKHFDASARYGINAMELLINKILNLGGKKRLLIAKAFGGGHILPAISRENGVGKRNSKFVADFLHNEGIEIVTHDFGGDESRKIYFYTDTGEVLLKRIYHNRRQSIAREERKQSVLIQSKLKNPGDVVLF